MVHVRTEDNVPMKSMDIHVSVLQDGLVLTVISVSDDDREFGHLIKDLKDFLFKTMKSVFD